MRCDDAMRCESATRCDDVVRCESVRCDHAIRCDDPMRCDGSMRCDDTMRCDDDMRCPDRTSTPNLPESDHRPTLVGGDIVPNSRWRSKIGAPRYRSAVVRHVSALALWSPCALRRSSRPLPVTRPCHHSVDMAYAIDASQGLQTAFRYLPAPSKRIPRLPKGAAGARKGFQGSSKPFKNFPRASRPSEGAHGLPQASKAVTKASKLVPEPPQKRLPSVFKERTWATRHLPKAFKRLPQASNGLPRQPRAFQRKVAQVPNNLHGLPSRHNERRAPPSSELAVRVCPVCTGLSGIGV